MKVRVLRITAAIILTVGLFFIGSLDLGVVPQLSMSLFLGMILAGIMFTAGERL